MCTHLGLQDVNGFLAPSTPLSILDPQDGRVYTTTVYSILFLGNPKTAGVMLPRYPHVGLQGIDGFVASFGSVSTAATPPDGKRHNTFFPSRPSSGTPKMAGVM